MGGPQAMLGWIFGAVLVCATDWSGRSWGSDAAPGGSYSYLKEIHNPAKPGRMISFLFIWQLTFSAPLSIASGCIGRRNTPRYMAGLQTTLCGTSSFNFH